MYDLRKYLIPTYQIPDAGNAVSSDAAPPLAAADATAGSLSPPAPDALPPAAAEPIVEPPPAPVEPPKTPKWMLDRITEITAKKQEAERRAEAADRRAAEAEALAQRLQTNHNPPSPEGRPNTNPVQLPPIPPNDPNFRNAVAQEAQRQRFYDDTVAVRSAGFAKFGPSFQESLQVLAAVNATTDDFIADVMATDKINAHVILEKIAKDPEKAVALANMDSRTRIAELTRMTMAQASQAEPAPAPKPAAPTKVSRAPAPPPPIEPSASKTIDWRSDEASDEEFTRGFEETMKKRSARR